MPFRCSDFNDICHELLLTPINALNLAPKKGLLINNYAGTEMPATLTQYYPLCQWQQITLDQIDSVLNSQRDAEITLDMPFDIVVAPLILHWHNEPLEFLKMLFPLIANNGVILFSIFGAASFREYMQHLTTLQLKAYLPHLIDLHHWGDALLDYGFSNPVISSENFTLEYSKPWKAWREIRHIAGMPAPPIDYKNLRKYLTTEKEWTHNSVEVVSCHAFVTTHMPAGAIPIHPSS